MIKEINTGSFDTIIGKVKLDDNLYKGVWAVGQWQGDNFYAIAPRSRRRARADRAEAGVAVGLSVVMRGLDPRIHDLTP